MTDWPRILTAIRVTVGCARAVIEIRQNSFHVECAGTMPSGCAVSIGLDLRGCFAVRPILTDFTGFVSNRWRPLSRVYTKNGRFCRSDSRIARKQAERADRAS
jgi:hypothetical protein